MNYIIRSILYYLIKALIYLSLLAVVTFAVLALLDTVHYIKWITLGTVSAIAFVIFFVLNIIRRSLLPLVGRDYL